MLIIYIVTFVIDENDDVKSDMDSFNDDSENSKNHNNNNNNII